MLIKNALIFNTPLRLITNVNEYGSCVNNRLLTKPCSKHSTCRQNMFVSSTLRLGGDGKEWGQPWVLRVLDTTSLLQKADLHDTGLRNRCTRLCKEGDNCLLGLNGIFLRLQILFHNVLID